MYDALFRAKMAPHLLLGIPYIHSLLQGWRNVVKQDCECIATSLDYGNGSLSTKQVKPDKVSTANGIYKNRHSRRLVVYGCVNSWKFPRRSVSYVDENIKEPAVSVEIVLCYRLLLTNMHVGTKIAENLLGLLSTLQSAEAATESVKLHYVHTVWIMQNPVHYCAIENTGTWSIQLLLISCFGRQISSWIAYIIYEAGLTQNPQMWQRITVLQKYQCLHRYALISIYPQCDSYNTIRSTNVMTALLLLGTIRVPSQCVCDLWKFQRVNFFTARPNRLEAWCLSLLRDGVERCSASKMKCCGHSLTRWLIWEALQTKSFQRRSSG